MACRGCSATRGSGIELTSHGLLARGEDAVAIAARCDREELPVEPVPWLAVRLARV